MKYGDMPSTTGSESGFSQPQMACENDTCEDYGITYSAERGDYFWARPSDEVICVMCEGPMRMVAVARVMVWQ